MKIALIVLAILLAPIAHRLLLKWIIYRWIINSIIFPINYYKTKQVVNMSSKKQLVDLYFNLIDKWFSDYWFGKVLIKIVEDRLLMFHNSKYSV